MGNAPGSAHAGDSWAFAADGPRRDGLRWL